MGGTFIAGLSDFFTSPEPGFLFQDVINGVMGQDHHGAFIFQVDRFVCSRNTFQTWVQFTACKCHVTSVVLVLPCAVVW